MGLQTDAETGGAASAPQLSISVETPLTSASGNSTPNARSEVDSVLEPEFEFIVPSIDYKFDLDNSANKEPLHQVGFSHPLGASGLWVRVSPRLRAEAYRSPPGCSRAQFRSDATGGYSQTMVIDYDKGRDPRLQITGPGWRRPLRFHRAGGRSAARPAWSSSSCPNRCEADECGGVLREFRPGSGADVNAGFSSGTLASADLGVTFNGHVNVGMSVLGVSNSLLPSFEPWDCWIRMALVFSRISRRRAAADPVQPANQTVPLRRYPTTERAGQP